MIPIVFTTDNTGTYGDSEESPKSLRDFVCPHSVFNKGTNRQESG